VQAIREPVKGVVLFWVGQIENVLDVINDVAYDDLLRFKAGGTQLILGVLIIILGIGGRRQAEYRKRRERKVFVVHNIELLSDQEISIICRA